MHARHACSALAWPAGVAPTAGEHRQRGVSGNACARGGCCRGACPMRAASAARVHAGVVQTAYANGAATAALRQRGVGVALALTGVKHLHAAAKAFDAGVYYEANGHGSVVLSAALAALLDTLPAEDAAVQTMRAFLQVRPAARMPAQHAF